MKSLTAPVTSAFSIEIYLFIDIFLQSVDGERNGYSSKSYSIEPKLDIELFVDLAEFPCFYTVLARPDHKIVLL